MVEKIHKSQNNRLDSFLNSFFKSLKWLRIQFDRFSIKES